MQDLIEWINVRLRLWADEWRVEPPRLMILVVLDTCLGRYRVMRFVVPVDDV
jgi:hypothetical protein